MNIERIEHYRRHPGVYGYYEPPADGAGQHHWFYELCWRTVAAWTPSARLLGRQDVEDIVGPYPGEVESLYIAARSDWARKAVIAQVGGLYVDMDFICLSDLSPLAVGCTAWDYVGYHEWGGRWMDNFFGARAGSPLVVEMAEHALGRARLDGRQLPWTAMSGQTVSAVLEKYPWSLCLRLPTHVVQPVAFHEQGLLFATCDQPDVARWWQCLGFMTSLHTMRERLVATFSSAEELLASDTWLAALIRRGLRGGSAGQMGRRTIAAVC